MSERRFLDPDDVALTDVDSYGVGSVTVYLNGSKAEREQQAEWVRDALAPLLVEETEGSYP